MLKLKAEVPTAEVRLKATDEAKKCVKPELSLATMEMEAVTGLSVAEVRSNCKVTKAYAQTALQATAEDQDCV